MDVVSTAVVRPVSVDILPAGLSAKLGFPQFAPIHVAEKLSPEVLGHDPVEIEHQVLIWKLDRVTRMGAREALNFFHALDCWHIQYKSVTESWLDSEGPVPMLRDILISIVGSFAKQERESLILRTKAGLARERAEGKVLGRPRKVFDREEFNEVA